MQKSAATTAERLLCHDYNCDSTTIRLRSDYGVLCAPASIRHEQKMNMSIFCRSCVVVVSQSNRTHIVISITFIVVECVVVLSCRSRIVVELQLWYRLKTYIEQLVLINWRVDCCCSVVDRHTNPSAVVSTNNTYQHVNISHHKHY